MLKKYNASKINWWLLAFTAVTAAVLGMSGFYQYHLDSRNEALGLPDLLYRTLQLFTLGSGALSPPLPLELEIARWLAPFVTFFAAIKGILTLIHSQSQSIFRLRKIHHHAVIAGLSRKGSYIARALLDRNQPVVVVERNAQNPYLHVLVQAGAIPIIGDARNPAVMEQAKVHTARYLLATTEEDVSNISIIMHAKRFTDKHSSENAGLHCYAHVANQATKSLFYNHPLFSESDSRFNAQLFNLYDRGARLLFEKYGPDRTHPVFSANDPQAEILLFGLNPIAVSLVLHAARTGHYANGKRLAITVIGEHTTQQMAALALSTPALDEVVDLTTRDNAIEALNTRDLLSILDNPPGAIYICTPSDITTMTLAQRLSYLLGENNVPIVATLLQADAMADLLCEDHETLQGGIHVFPLINNTSNLDRILGEQQDRAARLIHEMYCEDRLAHGETSESNTSLIPWDILPEGIKDSNRGQADHLAIKLRAIGLSLETSLKDPEPVTFTEAQIALLSEIEHRRWMADKRLDGWRYTPGKKDNALKLNPLLVDFDELPAEEKHKDMQTIITIPHLIELLKKDQ